MNQLTWHSSFASLTGYSGSSLAFVLGLDARGVGVRPLYLYGADHDEQILMGRMHPRILELQRAPFSQNAPQVVYAPGDRFSKNSGRYRVGYTMLEVDRLPEDWVAQANEMDEVWTPTQWGTEVFAASGVTRPIVVVPLGIDTARYQPGPPRTRLRDRAIFLSVFEWGPRKGWDVLLRAYRAAFKPNDPVLLLLKVDCRVPATNPLRAIAELLPEPSPQVGLIYNQPLSAAQMIELYQSADCFVLPTRGEGWGMPILESMACGVPAIATNWSGQTAFMTEANSYLLPARLAPAAAESRYTRGAQWAEPDLEALVELLRTAAASPELRRTKGLQAATDARLWGWDRGLDIICERLGAV